jgi:hypothetical protein
MNMQPIDVIPKPAVAGIKDTQTPNIGPGDIATSSETGGPAFALSSSEWYAIQSYVLSGLALPTTTDALKTALGSGAPADMSDFIPLLNAYVSINSHVNTWQTDTFPSSVSLASDIHSYSQQAPTYYNAILPLAQKLTANPNDQPSLAALTAVLGILSKSATQFQQNAAAVATKIQNFAKQTQSDLVVLSGTDGESGLVKYYNDQYGATSADVENINNQLKAEKLVLDAANEEYNKDVVIASTSPTYAWVFPFGTIAAAVVAGVYGDKAVKALERARAAQQQINSLSAQLVADANLLIVINLIESGIGNILGKLQSALPIIQKIEGVWGAIADDLNNLINLIQNNIADALPIIMNLGVESAITAWTAVGTEADAYRLNAYITVTPH